MLLHPFLLLLLLSWGVNCFRRSTVNKVTTDSIKMQAANELFKGARELLTLSGSDGKFVERELLALNFSQSGLAAHINRGSLGGGMTKLTSKPRFIDIACFGAYPVKCDPNAKYRTITGICNNLKFPLWGSASIEMRRFLPAQYADGIDMPRGTIDSALDNCKKTGNSEESNFCPCLSDPKSILPNPRWVSLQFHPDVHAENKDITMMVMQFGQFLDHDITLTPEFEVDEKRPCCNPDDPFSEQCFPIQLPCQEKHFNKRFDREINRQYGGPGNGCLGTGFLPFVRSLPFCECQFSVREQMNGISAFVDASNVYSSDPAVCQTLWDQNTGFMILPENLLPRLGDEEEFTAGDVRARENPGLTSLHTLFAREHNRVAEHLKQKYLLSPEECYERARRIVGAQMQNVVYDQFLTVVLGHNTMDKLELKPHYYSGYNQKLDPSIRNAFATAAFRFGHSLIQGLIKLIHASGLNSFINLRKHYFESTKYVSSMDALLAGMISQNSQDNDRFVTEDVTNHLFENQEAPGSDLVARNIQRGRDHGIPGYNDWRQFCGMPRICEWEKRPENIGEEEWQQLYELYDDPSDIDLFTAGLAEHPHDGGLVGQTFNCILGKQFHGLKFGDRFFFTHKAINKFSPDQLDNLFKRRLGDIMCDNTGLEEVKENVFLQDSPQLKCGDHNRLDWDLF